MAVARLGLTATGGGFPVKGIFRSATVKNFTFIYPDFMLFFSSFVLFSLSGSMKLSNTDLHYFCLHPHPSVGVTVSV